MLHYTSATSAFNPSQLNPRDRYLFALAQAKAAEAEYIAYEAKRDEKALLRRLQLQHAHRDTGPFSIFDHRTSHSNVSLQSQAYHPFNEDRLRLRLSLLEQEIQTRRRQEREASLLREQLCQALRKDHQSSISVKEQHHPRGVPYKSNACVFRLSTPCEGLAGKENDQSKVGSSKHFSFGSEEQLKDKVTTEICDTIHAILASLADSYASRPSEAEMSSSSKGKDRESGSRAGSAPPSQNATSKDVVQSFDLVQSIEGAFESLNEDFKFPSQLDFDSTYSRNDSDELAKGTSRLAFSSRNHPVRYYEQALTSLLARLDSVDSFGNEALRTKRKEVVCRVENALDQLERSIEESQRVVSAVSSNKQKAKEAQVLSPPSAGMIKEPLADINATDSGTIASDKIANMENEDVASPGVLDATNTETSAEVTAPSDSLVGDTNRALASSAGSVSEMTHSGDEEQVAESDVSQLTSGEEVAAESRKHGSLDVPSQATVPIVPNDVNLSPSVETEAVSAFLLTADAPQSPRVLRSHSVEDLGSDWSDVEE